MSNQEQSILAVLVYYDLFGRPLTLLEIFRSLAPAPGVALFDIKKALEHSPASKKLIHQKNGLFFLAGQEALVAGRDKKIKTAQLKWRRLKRLTGYLTLVPFLRLAAATGSLTANNPTPDSDLDLLIITAPNRLWLTRFFTTILTGLLGIRRHGQMIKDRLCFNYYLSEDNLNIIDKAKFHYFFHSAQEYSRLTPIVETGQGIYQKFISQNNWLADHLNFFPWPASKTTHRVKKNYLFKIGRVLTETALGGQAGDWLNKKAGQWQLARIIKKSGTQQPNQIYATDQCLMFYPQSKSHDLTTRFNDRLKQLNQEFNHATS